MSFACCLCCARVFLSLEREALFHRRISESTISWLRLACCLCCARVSLSLVGSESVLVDAMASQYQLDGALLDAASKGSLEEIQSLLINHQANVNALDSIKRTPLHQASFKGHHQCIELLIDHQANVNALDEDDSTPLHGASICGHHQCIELLIDHQANVNALDYRGNKPIDYRLIDASSKGSLEEIQSLLIDHQANVNALDYGKSTPLHLASIKGHHQCIKLLIDHQANVNALDINKRTPLHHASTKGHHQCIELLIDLGADKSIKDVRVCEFSLDVLVVAHIMSSIPFSDFSIIQSPVP